MVTYKCMSCQKSIKSENIKKRIRCPYCGYKIIYKPRTVSTVIDAV